MEGKVAGRRRQAEAEVEEELRRKEALLTQMHPECRHGDTKDTKSAEPTSPSKAKRPMQASVETDTEDNDIPSTTPSTTKGQTALKSPPAVVREAVNHPPPLPPQEHDHSLSLEKREGVYTHHPPSKFAREEVAINTLRILPPRSSSTAKRASRRSSNQGRIAVWSGDEVYIMDSETRRRGLSHRKRRHHSAH